jgi:hypothetical protein
MHHVSYALRRLVIGAAVGLAGALLASTAGAQGAFVGQSALPTARHTPANPQPAGQPRWACKTDCVVKLEKVADILRPEPPGPLPAVAANGGYRVPNNLVKRTRTPVEDAVFTSLDKSDRALGYRYKRPDGTKPVQ